MTEAILLKLIDIIKSNNIDYCAICLRTSNERRTQKPYHLKKFLQSINKSTFDLSHQKVCFMCERQAATAYDFVMAANLAIFAHDVIRWLENSKARTKSQFNNIVKTYNFQKHFVLGEIDTKGVCTLTKALDCEAKLRDRREQNQLLTTEVLVVSTQDQSQPSQPDEVQNFHVVANDQAQAPSMSEGYNCIYDLTDDPKVTIPSSEKNAQTATEDEKPTENQNEEIVKPKPAHNGTRLVPIEKLLEKQSDIPKTQCIDPPPSQSFLLHPIVFNSGMLTVPSLGANIINGYLVSRELSENNCILMSQTPKVAIENDESMHFVTEPNKVVNILNKISHQDIGKIHILSDFDSAYCPEVQSDSSNALTVIMTAQPDATSQSNCATILTTPTGQEVKLPLQVNGQTVFTTQEVNHSTQLNNGDGVKGNKNIDLCDNFVMEAIETSLGRKRETAQAPVLRSDRIDWEDKIPMDVISFVDANENSSKRVRRNLYNNSALGFISNVTSLYDATDDAIDLC